MSSKPLRSNRKHGDIVRKARAANTVSSSVKGDPRNKTEIVGWLTLVALLAGVVGYAVLHTGEGYRNPLAELDRTISGLQLAPGAERTIDHVEFAVDYTSSPPTSGDHDAEPQTCQVYDTPIVNEHAVHSLEHGAVWVTYNRKASKADVGELEAMVAGNSHRMMSPEPAQTSAISLQAWGRKIEVTSASDPTVKQFLDAYTSGPQAPEQGAPCVGTTVDRTGEPPRPAKPADKG